MNACISASAAREYKSNTRRNLTTTVGGLIQLLDFEIVATHLGPRPQRLTLLVKKFKSLGSDGSGEEGVPRPIESREDTKALLNQLIKLRNQEAARRQDGSLPEGSSKASSTKSHCGNVSSSEEAPLDSQATFTPQAPRSKEPAVTDSDLTKSGQRISTKSNSIREEHQMSDLQSQVLVSRANESVADSFFNPKTPGIQNAAIDVKKTSEHETLLNLLKQKKRALSPNAAMRDATPTRPDNASDGKGQPATRAGCNEKLGHTMSISKTSSNAHPEPSDDHRSSFSAESDPEIRKETLSEPFAAPSTGSHAVSSFSALDPEPEVNNPRKRINGRDIRIPKDQEAILSRTDCKWIH